jgi:predicted peptidase
MMTKTDHFQVDAFGTKIDYRHYKADSDIYLLHLHGRGQCCVGKPTSATLNLIEQNGYPKLIKAGQNMPWNVICPQAWTTTSDIKNATFNTITRYLIQYIKLYLGARKIFVTGLSLGGQETYSIAVKDWQGKQFVDGYLPIAGKLNTYTTTPGEQMHDVPCMAIHGRNDQLVPYTNDRDWVAKVNAVPGRKNKIDFITLEGVAHEGWTAGYNPATPLGAQVWNFINNVLGEGNDQPTYEMGYAAGYAVGKVDGVAEGYPIGFDAGKILGIAEGQTAGFDLGFESAKSKGISAITGIQP